MSTIFKESTAVCRRKDGPCSSEVDAMFSRLLVNMYRRKTAIGAAAKNDLKRFQAEQAYKSAQVDMMRFFESLRST